MEQAKRQLEYAPRPKATQKFVRRGLWLVLVLAGAWSTYIHRGQLLSTYREWRYRSALRQCLAYAPPTDQVVYDEDPTRAPPLLRSPGYIALASSTGAGNSPVAGFRPECWKRLEPFARSSFRFAPQAVLFMHERRTPWGDRKLVVVEAGVDTGGLGGGGAASGLELTLDAIDLDTFADGPRNGWGTGMGLKDFTPNDPQLPMNFRMFAGQADPNDPTHFTLPFEWKGQKSTIEVWVTNGPTNFFRVDSSNFFAVARAAPQ